MAKSNDIHKQAYEKQALQLMGKGFLLIRFFAGREEHYPFIWEIADALHQMPTIITQQPDRLAEKIEDIEQLFNNELSILEQHLTTGENHQ